MASLLLHLYLLAYMIPHSNLPEYMWGSKAATEELLGPTSFSFFHCRLSVSQVFLLLYCQLSFGSRSFDQDTVIISWFLNGGAEIRWLRHHPLGALVYSLTVINFAVGELNSFALHQSHFILITNRLIGSGERRQLFLMRAKIVKFFFAPGLNEPGIFAARDPIQVVGNSRKNKLVHTSLLLVRDDCEIQWKHGSDAS